MLPLSSALSIIGSFLVWQLMELHNLEWTQPGNSLLHPCIRMAPVSLSPAESHWYGEKQTLALAGQIALKSQPSPTRLSFPNYQTEV